jgi:ligand-binding sensor domain-containing protein
MSRLTIAIIHFALCSVISFSGLGQGEWPLQHIDNRSGLSNSAINAIYYDSEHYVWFGTWDGLNRYDGDLVVTFKPIAGDKYSISNNVIRQILEDKNGVLWVVTHDGINRYDRHLNRFHRYLNDLDGVPFLENNLQVALSEDSSLFVSLVGWGVGKYDQEKDEFIRISPENESLKEINGIGVHDQYMYLLHQNDQLLVYDQNELQKSHPIDDALNVTYNKLIKLNGKFFLIYQRTPTNLILKELDKGDIIASLEIETNSSTISCITAGKDQTNLYLGTDEGNLLQLKMRDDAFELSSLNELLPGLNRKKLKIFSVFESQQDLLWVGTDGDGVYKYLTKNRSFHSISEGNADEEKISNSIVRSILTDKKQNLYVGTRGGGLNILKKQSNKTLVYDKSTGLSDNTVLALATDAKGNVWIGLDSEGLDMIENQTGKIYHFPRDFKNDTKGLDFGAVYKICLDSYGHLWLGTSGYGIIYLDIGKDEHGDYVLKEHYAINTDAKDSHGNIQILSNIVYDIEEEQPNILWFGTRNGGLYRYNAITKKFTHNLQAKEKSRMALSNNDILSLYIDSKNQLWVGTSGGLNKVNLSNFTVDQYAQSDGLANNTIHGILEDYLGRLWLSSNNGLYAFNPENNTFKNFNWSDGLLNNEYTDGAYFQSDKNERLYFGGTNGVDIVFPSRLDTSSNFQKLAFSDLFLFNQRINPGDSTGILPQQIDLQQEISLNYDQNYLSLRFTTLDYWHKQRCKYRYYLENFDQGWIDIGKQSIINLTNIPPGQYTLHVNNSNENGDWNPEVRTLSINIAPPFWATATAYIIYIMCFLMAQGALIQFLRNRSKQKKHAEIERLKQEQSETIQKYKLE